MSTGIYIDSSKSKDLELLLTALERLAPNHWDKDVQLKALDVLQVIATHQRTVYTTISNNSVNITPSDDGPA